MINLVVLCLMVLVLVPTAYVYAAPRDAELVLENIIIEPTNPKKGEFVTITGFVYNAGLKHTNSFTSIITIAYFVDGKLLDITEIDGVKPGLSNKIEISSSPIWKPETRSYEIKVIVDYHDTIQDQYDSPDDNSIEKTFFIESLKPTKILLDASPQYFIQGTETTKITASLLDSDSNDPLNNQKIILSLGDNRSTLITDKDGKVSFSNMFNLSSPFKIEAYFDGDAQYSSSNSLLMLYPFQKEPTSNFIMKILDLRNQYTFEDNRFEILIFQDSYSNLIKKIQPDSTTLLDPKTFLISLPPEHHYFAEIYLDGRLFFVTDRDLLQADNVLMKELRIPEPATIRFKVAIDENQPVNGAVVKTWIYSDSTEDGFTDWITILPTTYGNPYIAEITLPDQRILKSDPFLLFSGEQKTIDIMINDISRSNIPSWIKNNAEWWAADQIDDNSFVQGIQFLIKEGIMHIPSTVQGSGNNTNEIPSWIKNNAEWWAADQIDDNSFVQGIQYLIKEGIMKIS
ncbi:MAG: hypothetical protein OES34_06180 [Nitrosopumilus sp.]|nr:hypothetical protein [Nitrosopumilus sp.]